MSDSHTGAVRRVGDAVGGLAKELADCPVIRLVPTEDKVAILEARVNQQSELIALLKQRADDTLHELNSCKQACTELQSQKDKAEDSLKDESQRSSVLAQRFNDLAANHEEMIRFKDEYKRQNERLREAVSHMREEREREEEVLRKSTVAPLEELLKERESEIETLHEKCRLLENSMVKTKESHTRQVTAADRDLSQLRKDLEVSKMTVTELRAKLLEERKACEDSKQECTSLRELCHKSQETSQRLDQEIKKFKELACSHEREIAELKRQMREQEEVVSRDECVMKLRKELASLHHKMESLEREFTAYKQHSSEQLKQERQLNEQLRHLAD